MTSADLDFSRLAGFELLGLDYTLSRMVVAEFIGPAKDPSGNQSADSLTQIYLYFIECAMLDADFISNPKASSSFPPFDKMEHRANQKEHPHRHTLRVLFKPGFIRLDFDDLVIRENKLPMSYL